MVARRVHLPMPPRLGRSPRRILLAAVSVVTAVALTITVVGVGPAAAALPTVGLGTAESFAVLAGSTVTNTGPSVIRGDVGVSPGTAVTGFPPGIVNNGVIHAADAVAAGAQSDLTIAYDDAAGRKPATVEPADLAGLTLVPGLYHGDTLGLSVNGTVTLNAQGDSNAVFIFQSASTLIMNTNSRVALINGAQACNVFWQVGSSATIGVGSRFVGTVLALASITAQTGATIRGRLLARNGAVTLDTNTITRSRCTAPTQTTTSTTPPGTMTSTTPPGTKTSTTPPGTTTSTTPPGTTTSTTPSKTTTSTTPSASTTPSSTTAATSATTNATTPSSTTADTSATTNATTPSSTTTTTTSAPLLPITGGTTTEAPLLPITGGGPGEGATGTLPNTGTNLVGPVVGGLGAMLLGGWMLLAARPTLSPDATATDGSASRLLSLPSTTGGDNAGLRSDAVGVGEGRAGPLARLQRQGVVDQSGRGDALLGNIAVADDRYRNTAAPLAIVRVLPTGRSAQNWNPQLLCPFNQALPPASGNELE